jgi:phage tail sheath protein FI
MSNIGLNVIETDGTATPAIQSAATSVAGFAITTPRGPVGDPGLVTSFAQFVERFGAPGRDSDGPLLVQGFFANGGRRAWICRVGGSTNQTAGKVSSATISQGPVKLTFTGGSRGTTELGTWADGLQVWVSPSAATTLREPSTTVTANGTAVASVRGLVPGLKVVLKGATGDPEVVTLATITAATGAITWTETVGQLDRFTNATTVTSTDFDLAVKAPRGADMATVESWAGLTLARAAENYVVTRLNDPARGSKWLVADDGRANNQTGAALVPATDAVDPPTLDGGAAPAPTEGDYAGDPVRHTGLLAFDPLSVQLVAVDTSDSEVIKAALAYCEARGDCMFVGSVPADTTVETAAEFTADKRGKKVFGALYGPRIRVIDPAPGATGTRLIPATGHVMGVYARTEATRGIHKAPAGDEARVLGAVDVEYALSDADHTFWVRDAGLNGIRALPGAGIVVDASRTLSSDTRWLYVNVRLLFNFVKSSLRDGLRWVRQEPNKKDLWDAVRFGTVRPFLMGLWRQGAFGTGDPDDVFTIVCDESNNPPDEVDKGNFNLQVTFWPSKPAETIVILVGQQPAGGSAAEG